MLFTPLEAARARGAVPEVLDGGHDETRVFLPEAGLDTTLLAVAMRDGACAYLGDDQRCRIHAAAGADHKPFGCRTFPARFVDTGAEIRVTPRPECACVFDEAGDAPMTAATRGRELPRETFVPRLPEAVRMGPHTVDRRRFVEWADSVELPAEPVDLAAWCDALADAVERRGPEATTDDADDAPPGSDPAHVEALVQAAERLAARHADWRSEDDLARRATDWVRAALRALREATPVAGDDRVERLYLRTVFFGACASDAASVEDDLRERALHLRIARAFPAEARSEPAARHPLALVEALARGHGLRRD